MRRTGYTTRLVDKAIQSLFTYGWIKFVTPEEYKNTRGITREERDNCLLMEQQLEYPHNNEGAIHRINEYAFDKVKKRLSFEHEGIFKELNIKSNLSIRFKNRN